MVITISTKSKEIISLSLKNNGIIIDEISDTNQYGSQVLLPLIEKILKTNQVKYEDLKGIEVETGPGSFTGLRVGVAVANALGFILKIPVNSKEIETELRYT